MHIQAEKLELLKLILRTDNQEILASVKQIFEKHEKVDFWKSLTKEQQEEIEDGVKKIENNQTIDYDLFITKFKK